MTVEQSPRELQRQSPNPRWDRLLDAWSTPERVISAQAGSCELSPVSPLRNLEIFCADIHRSNADNVLRYHSAFPHVSPDFPKVSSYMALACHRRSDPSSKVRRIVRG